MSIVNLTLESGRTVALEIEGRPAQDGMAPAGRTIDKALDLSLAAFDKGLQAAAELSDRVQQQLLVSGLQYSEAELHMDVTFSSEADIKVLRAGGEATLGLVVRWKPEV